jgi:hypothetical protein
MNEVESGVCSRRFTKVKDLSLMEELLYWLFQLANTFVTKADTAAKSTTRKRTEWMVHMLVTVLANCPRANHECFNQYTSLIRELKPISTALALKNKVMARAMKVTDLDSLSSFISDIKVQIARDTAGSRSEIMKQVFNKPLTKVSFEADVNRECDF